MPAYTDTSAPRAASRPGQRLRSSRLGVRLALSFGVLVALMLLVIALAVGQFRAMAQQSERVTQRDLQRMLVMQRIHQHAQGNGSAMARLLTAPRLEREQIYPLIDAEYAAIDRLLDQLSQRSAEALPAGRIAELLHWRNVYRDVFALVGEHIESGEADSARTLYGSQGQPALNALIAAADALLEAEQAAMQQRQRDIAAQMQRSEWLLAALAGVALCLSAWLAWRTTLSVSRPMRRVEAAAHRIAEGDYSATVLVRGDDELGRVAQAINAMSAAVAAREARIEQLAYNDPLTGLPNRTRLRRMFQGVCAQPLSVVLIDVARLGVVNEALGFDTGDVLLACVAQRLQTAVQTHPGTTAPVPARLAGGVLAVLWPGAPRAALEPLREELDVALAVPALIHGHELDVQLVYGLAWRDAGTLSGIDELLRGAEAALAQAKQSRLPWAWHVPVDDAVRTRQLSLLSELKAAAAGGELELWLQPKQCLRSGAILGMEGLVRWRHAQRGYVSPADFVPFAERAGHIGVITRAMLDAALARLALWKAAHPRLSIAVNVSALDLQDMGLVQLIEQRARHHGAPLANLRLEITESSVMQDADRVLPVLHALRAIGVKLSIDDFGTGYSSLAYLQRLPVDELKIDRSFVADADRSAEAQALLRTIVELGHSLALCVTAEGIERPEELALLQRLGCDMAQGYWISRPMDPQAAARYVAAIDSRVLEAEPV